MFTENVSGYGSVPWTATSVSPKTDISLYATDAL